MAPRISFKGAPKIEIKSKFMVQKFMGPRLLEDGSVNHLKITKEEQAMLKKQDQVTLPLCLETTPRSRRNSIHSEIDIEETSVL